MYRYRYYTSGFSWKQSSYTMYTILRHVLFFDGQMMHILLEVPFLEERTTITNKKTKKSVYNYT